MHLRRHDIETADRVFRLNLINSITGIKPANLMGTQSTDGGSNLAIFSSVVHLGSVPPLIGCVVRPDQEVRRHTFENMQETGVYTINHVHTSFIEKAHYTSAKFDKNVSEFERCGFGREYIDGFLAPFVKESPIKLGMRFCEAIPIKRNGTMLIVGEIEHLLLPDEAVNEKGYVDLRETGAVGISGLNRYYGLEKIGEFPYARVKDVPSFD